MPVDSTTVIGIVADAHALLGALTMTLMLRDRSTTIPIVVFSAGTPPLPESARKLLLDAGVHRVTRLHPMPVPVGFDSVLATGRRGRRLMFERLGLWSHIEYRKIISLDLDILVNANIDEMAGFPPETFSPNICTYGCNHRVAGHNSGVMVLGPSRALFDAMCSR